MQAGRPIAAPRRVTQISPLVHMPERYAHTGSLLRLAGEVCEAALIGN